MQNPLRQVACVTFGRVAAAISLWLVCFDIGFTPVRAADGVRFDVNDVAFLWPAPNGGKDLARLISIDEPVADGAPLWPRDVFDKVLATAQTVEVAGSGGASFQIDFDEHLTAFKDPGNWKVAGFRIDPSAPGSHSRITGVFGSRPQIRVIAQPVTLVGDSAKVHDITAHLIFDFASAKDEPPVAEGLPRRAVPDRDKFRDILADLQALKAAAGVPTQGPLGVHPAFRANTVGFPDKVKAFLKKHLEGRRLTAVAFMGIQPPEPWIFFALAKTPGGFVPVATPALKPATAQMLTFRGGDHVMPAPRNATFRTEGVSTAPLYSRDVASRLDSPALPKSSNPELQAIKIRDIPDIIANPQVSHFFNTDCLSCHSESMRRSQLTLTAADPRFGYQRPDGISGVDPKLLPQADAGGRGWNVRNFGWFPDFFNGKVFETVTMRTANEAAESADFINREYFGQTTPTAAEIAGPQPAAEPAAAPGGPRSAASALTLVMTIKSPQDYQELKSLLEKMQKLPPDQNPIARALTKLGNVHFARFVFIGEDKLAVITTYDDSFDTYINSFTNEIGPIFDQLLAHMQDAPPLPVREHRAAFLAYVRKHDLTCIPPFYSAYPALKVQDILTLQKRAATGE